MSRDSAIWAQRTHASHNVPSAWVHLLAAHAAITRELHARMLAAHGLSLTAYEALLFLSWAPERRLRRSDLAERTLLTQGGITRLLKGLEADGLVQSTVSDSDRRVVYASLTRRGGRRLDRAAADHAEDIDRLFTRLFADDELRTLADLLPRLHRKASVDSPASRNPGRKHPT